MHLAHYQSAARLGITLGRKQKGHVFTELITMATADPVKESSMQETKSGEQNIREIMLSKR